MCLTARIFIALLGTLSSLAMLVFGLAFLWHPSIDHARIGPALACLTGGALVAMLLVIDPLIPDATPGLTLTLKLGTALACCAAGVSTLYPVLAA